MKTLVLDTQDGAQGMWPSPRRATPPQPRVPAAQWGCVCLQARVLNLPVAMRMRAHEGAFPGCQELRKEFSQCQRVGVIITNNQSPEAKLFHKSTVVKGKITVTQ